MKSRKEHCECGCGKKTTRIVRMIPEQYRGTCEALRWREASIAPMRDPVWVVAGHDEDGVEGYITEGGAE